MKKILLVVTVFLVIGVACKDKKKTDQAQTVKQEVERPIPPPPDTLATPDPAPAPEPTPEPDKYYLIAASFSSQSNAEKYKNQLNQQGFQSQVITRNWGPNSEFYKVSYMGFSDKQQAISKMKQERNQTGKEDVWVLVKK